MIDCENRPRRCGAGAMIGAVSTALLLVVAGCNPITTYRNWEGRPRPFEPALPNSGAVPDLRVLHMIADEMGVEFGLPHPTAARDELDRLSAWDGLRADGPSEPPGEPPAPGPGQAVLASWRMLSCWRS